MFCLRFKGIREICLALAVILLPISLHSQTGASKGQKHCLWKITSSKNTVFFLGSIHLLKKENYPLPDAFEQAFQEAEIAVLELNPDSLSPARLQALTLAKGMYQNGKTLQASLAPETYKLVDDRLREMGMAAALLNNFEPWLVAVTIATLKLQQLGLDPSLGVDKHFFDKAKLDKKEILSFETVEYQLDRIDGLSPKLQEAFLLQTLKDWDLIAREFDELVQAWATGATPALEAMLFESFEEFPEVYARLIIERNQNWLPQIETFLQQERDYLLVVGAGHLVGKDSVLELLRAKGYEPEQL
ncbi:MAG: TraB/GumN family protein [bacterium]